MKLNLIYKQDEVEWLHKHLQIQEIDVPLIGAKELKEILLGKVDLRLSDYKGDNMSFYNEVFLSYTEGKSVQTKWDNLAITLKQLRLKCRGFYRDLYLNIGEFIIIILKTEQEHLSIKVAELENNVFDKDCNELLTNLNITTEEDYLPF